MSWKNFGENHSSHVSAWVKQCQEIIFSWKCKNYMQYFINLNWALSPTLCTVIKIHPLYKMLLWNVLSRLNINYRDATDLITALDAVLKTSDRIFMVRINTSLQVQLSRLWAPLIFKEDLLHWICLLTSKYHRIDSDQQVTYALSGCQVVS